MKIVVIAIGRMKAGPEGDLLRRYIDRAELTARGVGLTGIQVIELDESRARSADQRKREEAASLRARLPEGAAVLLLDEGGASLSSEAFAVEVGRARDAVTPAMAFVIGGPDGLDPTFLSAHRRLGFGAATFPHQIVRVMLAEQIYRAITILSGHPYHRA